MSITCGFFNSLNGDRKYNADQLSGIFDGIIIDGVFASIGTAFNVEAAGGLVVNIGIGKAWFNSTWIKNDAILPMTLSEANILLDRIDCIVIEVNKTDSVRDNTIKIIEGSASSSPARPILENEGNVHQYPLCYIYRKAGSTSISQQDITPMVGSEDTPFVTGIVQTISLDELLGKWQDELDQFVASEEDGFSEWFSEIKGQLSGDVAGRLTEEVNNLTEQVDQLTDKAVTPQERNKWNTPGDIINGTLTVWQRYKASSGATYTNPSNQYVADRFRANGSGTVKPNARGYGADITGTITMQYWMEKADFALLPDPVVVYYSIDGQMQTASTAKSSVQTDSDGNACIFSQAITNQTLDWVSLYPGRPVRPYVEEFALCQRYYQSLTMSGVWLPSSSTSGIAYCYFDRINSGMRVTPTAPQTVSGAVFSPAGWSVSGAVSLTELRIKLEVSGVAQQTANTTGFCEFQVTLDAEIY